MKTQIKKSGDTTIVSLNGRLDFETHAPLREDLSKLINEARNQKCSRKIVFNLDKLEFVGSSGISSFVQTLKEFNAIAPTRPRYCHVKSEFRKVIQAFDEEALFDFYDSEDRALKSFDISGNS